MRVGVIQFPGTNCERETSMAVKRAGMEAVPILWNENPQTLRDLDGFILPGGFSYEDRSRSGVIAALDPIMEVISEQSTRGKPVLGICNGAQILVEAGLVPGTRDGAVQPGPRIALTPNKRIVGGRIAGTGYYNAWVTLRTETVRSGPDKAVFSSELGGGELMRVPAAHAEGRFVMSDVVHREVESNGLVLFRYTDGHGRPDPEFPVNPNGSIANIAAVTNHAGNVLAIMPHPERTEAGDGIFRSMRRYLETAEYLDPQPAGDTHGVRVNTPPPVYRSTPEALELTVELVITDNEAVSVENALTRRGIPVSIQRRVHWEIVLDGSLSSAERESLIRGIHASGELYNSNKEKPVAIPECVHTGNTFLVRDADDIEGTRVRQILREWFGYRSIESIRHGVLWTICSKEIDAVLESHILMNPVSQKVYRYE